MFTSYDFGTENRTKCLLEHGFTEDDRQDLTEKLKEVTMAAMLSLMRFWQRTWTSLQKLEEIRKKEERLLETRQAILYQILQAVQNLRAGLQHYGTPQFARQARMAFMARAFLRSLTENGPAGRKKGGDLVLPGGYGCIYAVDLYGIHGI